MNLDHHFFQVTKLSEEQKKGFHQKWKTFFPRIQLKTKKKVFTKNETRRVARNLQWGGANFWVLGRSLQPPKANGAGGEDPSCSRRHGSLGAEPLALENFAFFCKNSLILELS